MKVFDRAVEDGGQARVHLDPTTGRGGSPQGGVQILEPCDLDHQVARQPEACSPQDRCRRRGLPAEATPGLGRGASWRDHRPDKVRSLSRRQGRKIEGEGAQADPKGAQGSPLRWRECSGLLPDTGPVQDAAGLDQSPGQAPGEAEARASP